MDYDLYEWKMILAPSALIICILWDIVVGVAEDYWNARISSWVPRNLFVLSALTIQILGYVDVQKVNVFGTSNEKELQVLVDNQLRMDAARLTMCVFVRCLLPGMATVGILGRWSNVAALFLTLAFHIATEIYALQNVNNSLVQSEAGPWFIASGVVLLVGASSLLLLLGAVILSGKFFREFTRPDDIDVQSQGVEWKMLRSEVMESSVAARAWKTHYFIISSMYSPGAGMMVTICVVAVKMRCRSSLFHRNNNGGGNLSVFSF
ncbi:hypothetical protein SUGI_0211540 [Cryptomeria japonica]|nr:hypothetical protein SUGI_0211540 [Cryptomeria japonica]